MPAPKAPISFLPRLALRDEQGGTGVVSLGADKRHRLPPISRRRFDPDEDRRSEALECSGVKP